MEIVVTDALYLTPFLGQGWQDEVVKSVKKYQLKILDKFAQ